MNLLQRCWSAAVAVSVGLLHYDRLMILVLWFFMWRPESKRCKEMQKFREGLKKGDKVITAGGIYGTVKEIKERTLLIEVDGNVTLRVDKNMVVADTTDLQK